MAVYNGDRFLAAALDSVLTQTFRDWELIVVDDGSTDRTPEILNRYHARDERLRILHGSHSGLAASLNKGAAVATGDLIARMDADDISLPPRLEEQFRHLAAHPEIGVLGTFFETISPEGDALGRPTLPLDDAAIRAAFARAANPVAHPTVMMRKALFEAAGGYRAIMISSEDYDLWLRLQERCRFENLPQVLLRYRVHGTSASVTRLTEEYMCMQAAILSRREVAAGRSDPLSTVDRIGREVLERHGFSTRTIDEALAARYFGLAVTRLSLGDTRTATMLMAEGRRFGMSRALRLRFAAHRFALLLRSVGRPETKLARVEHARQKT